MILLGDSAGGNLVAALTALCIKKAVRIPDAIVLCYPALKLSTNSFTPSLLLALDDVLLPHTFLKMCIRSYI